MKGRVFVLIVAVLAVLFSGVSTADLVAHWKLDGNANDSAGSNDGAIQSDPQWTGGIYDQALDFDGTDDYILGSTSPFDFENTTFSVALWFKTTNVGRFLVTEGGYSSGWYSTVNYGGKFGILLKQSNGGDAYSSSTVNSYNDDKWHHAVAIITTDTISSAGNNAVMYIDGDLVDTTESITGHYSSSNEPWRICRRSTNERYFDGLVDDVRIYDHALSAEEVEELYYGQLLSLEVVGPDEVAENFQAQYKAIADYELASDVDVTDSVNWSVEPNDIASIAAGLLTTEMVDLPMDVTITAVYSEGDANETAEKDVSILAICPSGSALEFDGVDDYVDCGNDESLNVTELTWALWIKRGETTYSSERALISNTGPKTGPTEAQGTYALQIDEGGQYQDKIQFLRHKMPVEQCPLSETAITDTNWHHIAVTRYINGDVTIYIDGNEDATGYLPERTAYGKTLIGTGHESYSNFKGTIDEVAIFNRALSAEEIQTLMHTRPEAGEPNLVGYWNFDEGSDQEAADSSGNGNDGQLGSTGGIDDNDPNWVDSDAPVGICTLDGLVERNISNVLDIKAEILDLLNIALGKEDALLDYMDDAFHNGQFDNLKKGDVVKAKQKIMGAIQQEEQAETAVDQSIDKLDDALDTLGLGLNLQE